MRAWLNITWAKLAAFFLTLLFGLATILGSIGIAILAYNNVFLDKASPSVRGCIRSSATTPSTRPTASSAASWTAWA